MDKKQKKSLRRHLLVIYIFYFLALAAGFIHSFVPHVSSSLATGWQAASEDIRMQEKHGIAQHTYFLAARLQNAQSDETLFPIETGHASISTEAEYTGVNIYVKTDENSDPTVVRTLNRINYILLLSIPALLAKLSILILVALIINILRKSVRDEQPLPGRIIIYTRAVGFLLSCGEPPPRPIRKSAPESALIFTRVRPGRFSKIRPCKSPPRSRSTTGTSSWRFWYSSRPRSSRSDPG